MSFQIRAEILGNMDNFGRTMKRAEKQLKGMEKVTKQISTAMKGAFTGAALAGLNMLWDGMKDVTNAAAEEAKSVALLEQAMNKSWKSNALLNAQQEEFIKQMSYMSAIADDQLRPAYAKIVRVTKDATKAQKYFTLALDIAAGTGKDVNVVSQAMAKYLGGNKTALDKLVPGLKDAGDKMKFLAQYTGAAETAGMNMPFEKMQVIFDDISERLGGYLLPYVQDFVTWLSGPEAEQMINDTFEGIQSFFDWLKTDKGKESIEGIVDALKELAGALAEIGKFMSENKWIFDTLAWTTKNLNPLGITGNAFKGVGDFFSGGKPQVPAATSSPVQVNVKVDGSFNNAGQFVVNSLKKEAGRRGVTVGKMIQ